MLSGNLKLQGNLILLYLLKLIFKPPVRPPPKYLNSTSFFLPQMKPFANISRTKVDDPKYNKLLHSDSLWSLRVFLNNLKSTYEEFKSSRLFKVFLLSAPAFSPSPCICRLAEVYKSFKIIFQLFIAINISNISVQGDCTKQFHSKLVWKLP